MTILEELFALQDEGYADFQSGLVPGVPRERFIGVRVPVMRKFARRAAGMEEAGEFLRALPHAYYDEDILHALLLSGIKDYDDCVREVEVFLPYVDNWAVCDILSPKVFKKHRGQLLGDVRRWAASPETYTCRFGVKMLMDHFLDEDYRQEYLEIPAAVRSEEYYVRMMIAWFFATALAKQWGDVIVYLEENRLERWVHNKAIQKACESYRIMGEQKAYLRTLRV